MAIDKIKPLKLETDEFGTQIDYIPTESNPTEDYITSKGISFENSDIETLDLSPDNNIQSPSLAAILQTKNLVDELKPYTVSLNHQYVTYDQLTVDGSLKIDGDVVIFS